MLSSVLSLPMAVSALAYFQILTQVKESGWAVGQLRARQAGAGDCRSSDNICLAFGQEAEKIEVDAHSLIRETLDKTQGTRIYFGRGEFFKDLRHRRHRNKKRKMKSEGSDFCKVALVFGMIAFQLHILTMTTSNFLIIDSTTLSVDRSNHRNNVIQAFIIIAYLLYVASVLLLLALSYSSNGVRGSKALSVFTAFILFIAASSVIIGLAVFDAETYQKQKPGQISRPFSSYLTTTYVTAAASGYASCIVLLVSLCM